MIKQAIKDIVTSGNRNLDEAVHYQTEYGGKINKLSHIVSEHPETVTEYDDGGGATTTYYGFDEDERD